MTQRSFPHLGFDPTPGDPGQVRTLARQIGDIYGELDTTVGELVRLDTGAWKGEAAKAFVDHIDHDVAPLIQKAYDSFGRASSALHRWADQLAGFQGEADALEREAATQQGTLDHAKSAAGMPPDDSHIPHPRPEASPDPDTSAAADAEAKKKQAVSDARVALDGVRHRARELHNRYTHAAHAISYDLDKAGDIAPDKPGLFHRIAQAVEGAWDDTVKWVQDHADLIKMVGDLLSALTGVLAAIAIFTAPFEPIGAIFAGAALIAGTATLATHLLAKAAGADVSWLTLGLDVIGTVPGIGGFTKGAKIAKLGRTLGKGEAELLAKQVAGASTRLTGEAVKAKKFLFVLGNDEGFEAIVKGHGLVGRGRAAIEGAIQFERGNQIAGTKAVNSILERLGRDPIVALTRPARVIDGTSKIATKIPGTFEIRHDVHTFDKHHPEVADGIKTAAKTLAWVVSEGPG